MSRRPGGTAPDGRRRAMVTGLGAITPSGLDVASLWDSVVHGRSAITRLTGPEFDGGPTRIGGLVRGFDPAGLLPRGEARRLSRSVLWAVAAADQAVTQSLGEPGRRAGDRGGEGPGPLPWDPERVDVLVATASGPVEAMQSATRAMDARGPRAVPLSLAMHGSPDAAASILSRRYRIFGPAHAVSATCGSGAFALGEGLRSIRHGYADAVIVVGVEDCLNPVNLASDANLLALARGHDEDPAAASRPFDRARSGFVMSAGAAAVLLESEESARARGVAPSAELAGFGGANEAHHPTAPHPRGAGGERAVRACLTDAGVGPGAVDHLNTHGTGTPAGDAAELVALEAALGARARRIPLTATKSSTGHLLGAAGIVEAVLAVMTLRTGLVPPIRNLDDPEFDGWDYVTGAARAAAPTSVLSTSFGFGGHNGAVLFTSAG